MSDEERLKHRAYAIPISSITRAAEKHFIPLDPMAVVSVRTMDDRLAAQVAPVLFTIVHRSSYFAPVKSGSSRFTSLDFAPDKRVGFLGFVSTNGPGS